MKQTIGLILRAIFACSAAGAALFALFSAAFAGFGGGRRRCFEKFGVNRRIMG